MYSIAILLTHLGSSQFFGACIFDGWSSATLTHDSIKGGVTMKNLAGNKVSIF